MAEYRYYLIEFDGYLVGSTALSFSNDANALVRATEMLRTFNAAVEVWDGSRKVGHLEPTIANRIASIEQVPTMNVA
jgi:hypothetical protein